MLFQLRKLSDQEKEVMTTAPIWAATLIAAADGEISDNEIEKLKKVVHIKTFSEHNDVEAIYEALEVSIEESIDTVLSNLETSGGNRIQYLSDKLAQLNDILPKLNETYAKQYYNSLREVAVAVANASGGILGMGSISWEEEKYLHLPMINQL